MNANYQSLCADRDRKQLSILESNRLERAKREEAENERMQNTNSILNSYIEKAKERERQQLQEHSQMVQNMHDEDKRRRAEGECKTKEISSVINRSLVNSCNTERNASDDYLNKHKWLLDKGREAVKREQSKTYFS